MKKILILGLIVAVVVMFSLPATVAAVGEGNPPSIGAQSAPLCNDDGTRTVVFVLDGNQYSGEAYLWAIWYIDKANDPTGVNPIFVWAGEKDSYDPNNYQVNLSPGDYRAILKVVNENQWQENAGSGYGYTWGDVHADVASDFTVPSCEDTYTVTYDGNGNTGGTAPVDPSSPYEEDDTVTVLGQGDLEKSGCTFLGWLYNGTTYQATNTFTMPDSNVTLVAQWDCAQAPNPEITITKIADPTTANPGDTITYTITVENTGNVPFSEVKVTDSLLNLDSRLGLGVGESYTLDEQSYIIPDDYIGDLTNTATAEAWCQVVTRAVNNEVEPPCATDEASATVTVTAAGGGTTTTTVAIAGIMNYIIDASSGSGGSISDPGITTLNEGDDKTYTMNPKDGYEISDVLVDGVSVGAVESYSFIDVAADHTIYVDFGIIGQTEVAGITEETTVEVLGVTEELPYTGFNWMYAFIGLGMLLVGSGFMLLLKKLKRASA